jgi:UDP-N-acetyl-D-glucosamine dehydrogenase
MIMNQKLIAQIADRDAVVGIIGLGYVGLPLLIAFARNGFAVRGFDLDAAKIAKLEAGESYIRHIPAEDITEFVSGSDRAAVTDDFARSAECDAILICVPTPLTEHRAPDLSYITGTAHRLGPYLRRAQLIVLESTTFPGTTEDELIPILERESGLDAGKDFFVAYSPEREDPNNTKFSTTTIPKVVGGITPESLAAAEALYNAVICETVPVSNCRTAEATKLMENIFRSVNIALVNELKVVFSEMDIDVWEVINAAKTKPFGFMPFYPGPGLGGHCIPIDPFYLTWKAKEFGVTTRFIELAGEVNTSMPDYVVQKMIMALNDHEKALKGSRLLLVGLAYKKNVDDYRESPAFPIWRQLVQCGAEVDYYDPYCDEVQPTREYSQFAGIASRDFDELGTIGYDGAIITTAHDNVDHDALAAMLPLVVDTRNACSPAANIYRG